MSNIATLSSKFQISIPKRVREHEGWRPGQRLAFLNTPDGVALVPVPSMEEMLGLAEGANPDGYRDRDDRF